MPGTAIEQYLAADVDAHFDKIAQVFRHDFILYAGMLLSWAWLFEGEIMAQPEIPREFATATEELLLAVQQLYDSAQPHLHPTLPQSEKQRNRARQVAAAWAMHHQDFAVYMRPHLERLEPQVKAYVTRPEFKTMIQQHLEAAADHTAIDNLLLDTYAKLLALLDPDQFDRRIATVIADHA